MSSANFAPFVSLPVVILEPGRYVTRCGEVVTVEQASTQHKFACVGTYGNGVRERWHKTGRLYFDFESPNDILHAA